jgi:transglutaminase-like putative cysteine protease
VPAQRNSSLLALAVLSGVATLGFARLFGESSWLLPVLLAVAGAHGLGTATRRWPAPLALVASALALALLVANVVAGHTTFYGAPTGATLDALGRAWTSGLDAFRNAVAPTPVTPGLLLLGVGGTWVCATAADWLAFRAEATLTAIVPPFVLYVVAAALGTVGLQVPTTFAFVVAALVFVATHHAAGLPTAWFAGRTPPPGMVRLAMGGAPVAVAIAAAGLVLGPALPGARAEAILELRGSGGGGDTSRITVSPLVDLKPRLTASPVAELFTVRSPVPTYWRLTALEAFDGRIWSSRGTYKPAEGRLPGDGIAEDLSYRIRQEFRIGVLDSFWLPAAYRPVRINLEGARVNAESLTLLTEEDSASGLFYRVESAIPRYSSTDLAASKPATDADLASYLELPEDFPDDVRALATDVTSKASGPYEAALALQNHLRTNYQYDEAAPAGHSNDHLRYFLFRSKIGYCEQFAGAFAAMARSVGLPARVAVGFTPGTYDPNLDVFHVTTKEAHAWPEVYFAGQGWVAFEPTPGRFEPNPTNYTGTFNPAANPVAAATTTTTGPDGAAANTPATVPRDQNDGFDETDPSLDPGPNPLLLAALLAVPLTGLILSVPPLLKRRRRARRRRAQNPGALVAGAWSEALDRLREAGATPALASTPLEFAGRAEADRPGVGTPLALLARVFTKAAYSGADPTDAEAAHAWEAVDDLSSTLDSGDTWLRRWRRRVNPVTLLGRT